VVLVSYLFQQFVRFLRSSATVLVRNDVDVITAGVNLVQQRREDVPRRRQLVVTDKGRLPSTNHFQNQTRVRVKHIDAAVPSLVTQVEFRRDGPRRQTGTLDIGLHVDGLVGL